MEYRDLGQTGLRVSVIGFGASPLGNEFRTIDPAEGQRAVRHAIDHGINLFDVSPYYGRTLAEERLGSAIEGMRDQVILATKCGRYDVNNFEFSAARVASSLEESLRRLRTDHLDILQAHDIEFGDREQIVNETIPALKKLKQQGKVRFIGVTGLPLEMLADVAVRGGVDVVLSYSRYNLLIRDLDTLLAPAAREHGIGIINASPLHMGLLTGHGPPAWHPAPEAVKQAAARMVELCRERGVSAPDVALRFCLDYPDAASTLVGMSNVAHVDTNLRALDTRLDPDFLQELDLAAGDALNVTWPSGRPENQDYKS